MSVPIDYARPGDRLPRAEAQGSALSSAILAARARLRSRTSFAVSTDQVDAFRASLPRMSREEAWSVATRASLGGDWSLAEIASTYYARRDAEPSLPLQRLGKISLPAKVRMRDWERRPKLSAQGFVPATSLRPTVDYNLCDGAARLLTLLVKLCGTERRIETYTISLANQIGRTTRTIQNYYKQLVQAGYLIHHHDRYAKDPWKVTLTLTHRVAPIFNGGSRKPRTQTQPNPRRVERSPDAAAPVHQHRVTQPRIPGGNATEQAKSTQGSAIFQGPKSGCPTKRVDSAKIVSPINILEDERREPCPASGISLPTGEKQQTEANRRVGEQGSLEHRQSLRERTANSRHIDVVGERVDLTAEVFSRRSFTGKYGTVYRYSFVTENGDVVKWFASGRQENTGNGSKVQIRGTVKKHEEYKGMQQTILTRCKLRAVLPQIERIASETQPAPSDGVQRGLTGGMGTSDSAG
jgi:hypothetical protein